MSKGGPKQKNQQHQSQRPNAVDRGRTVSDGASTAIPDGLFFLGLMLLVAAVALTGAMVAGHLGSLSLPGCRPGGACEQAAASFWGKVPGTTWPVSFVGLAYFVGMLFAWLTSKNGVSAQMKLLVRMGALVSVMYIVILIVNRHACYYCIGTHAANLLFWLVVERLRPLAAISWRPVVTTAVVFLLASAALGATEWRGKKAESQRQETELAQSTKEIIQSSSQPASKEDSGTVSVTKEAPPDRPWKGGFTGRYRWGPEKAAIRIVMITDYQCPDCARSEKDLIQLMNARNDVSVSVKHFPFCVDCNSAIKTNLHPNACWAARAAEAAGILRGPEGFWEMHKRLFEMKGSFTNEEFNELLNRLQYDRQEFVDVMMSKATLDLVQNDVKEAVWLGLHYTPMIFINGRELKGVFAHEALSRAVADIAATNPAPATCENDQPETAAEKYISDWKEKEMQLPGEDIYSWPMGDDGSSLHVVLWGDYQEPNTAKADAAIRRFVSGRKGAQYSFRHYPVNQQCNQMAQLSKHPNACRMASAAEAAGMLFGIDAFWQVHEWLMQNQANYSDDALREAVKGMGYLPDALFAKMDSPEVLEGIRHDCEAAKRLGLTSVPYIYVNQRFVPRWWREGDNIIEKIMEAAIKESEERQKPQQAAATP